MGMKQRSRNPDIHLSQKDIVTYFDLTDKDVDTLIRNKLLTPKRCGGKILFRMTELMKASFYFDNNHIQNNPDISIPHLLKLL
jgi:hypothetical protein